MQALLAGFFFVFGAIIGSFLNVVVWRLPRGKHLGGRSYCPQCHKQLTALELVPVVSWLFLRTRCKGCKKVISARYPIVELLAGALSLGVFWVFMPQDVADWLMVARALFITYVLIVVFIIDLEHYLILDKVMLPASIIVCCFNIVLTFLQAGALFAVQGIFISGIAAAAFAFLFFGAIWYISKGAWLGFGDVKYVIFMGLCLGFPQIVVGLMLAFYLGALVSIPLLLFQKKGLKSMLPFGTFLSVATFIALLYGNAIFVWYLAMLGL